PSASRRELSVDHVVKQVLAHLGSEHLVSELDLADLLTLQVVNVDFCHGDLAQLLISTSTPADRSSFIKASSVWGVGSRMSMRRLWVRTSNCSRAFLSTCGPRSTV